MNNNFEFITNLQYKVKALSAQVDAFKSGEKYISMKSEFDGILAAERRMTKKRTHELTEARRDIIKVRNNYFQVIDDMEKQYEKERLELKRLLEAMEKRALKAEQALDVSEEIRRDLRKQLYDAQTELEEEKGKTLKLTAQINRDYENSSISSSLKMNRDKIRNSREKTGKKPGAQPGHKGHGRKKQEPTSRTTIPVPEVFLDRTKYKPTGKIITKQVVNFKLCLVVDEFRTPEYRNLKTGQRVHADFPEGLVNEVTYGGSVKAFAFLLNTHCCVSLDKVQELITEMTGGKLQLSKGMLNGLTKEFSEKTECEQKEVFCDLLISPVMNVDFTSVKVNGENTQVAVCTAPQRTLYFARESKGHEGVKGTPVEDYQGILVHDHDVTFYNYGSQHQECLAHILRYLINSMENEPNLQWNKQMWSLIREMIHYRNSLEPDDDLDSKIVEAFVERYQKILTTAKEEYEYEPPSKYYKEGFNLYKRLDNFKDSHLLFLYDKRVPTTNNIAEKFLRSLKRKSKQVMAFRSFDSLSYLCDCMGMISLLRTKGESLYKNIASIFN